MKQMISNILNNLIILKIFQIFVSMSFLIGVVALKVSIESGSDLQGWISSIGLTLGTPLAYLYFDKLIKFQIIKNHKHE